MFSIFEPQRPNSGSRFRGKYLERCRVAKPQGKVNGEPDYYDIDDFYIGEFSINRVFQVLLTHLRALGYLKHKINLPRNTPRKSQTSRI